MDTVEITQVIITTLTRRGTGQPDDPVRIITEIWRPDGQKIAEIDPWLEEVKRAMTVEDER